MHTIFNALFSNAFKITLLVTFIFHHSLIFYLRSDII
nr:MAG TPA: hypothetical protein [Caudoviricetes sp.]